MSSELQLAYEHSMLTTEQRRPDPRDVDQLLRCGFFLVLGRVPRYCRITDAMLPGYDEFIEKACPTRAEAQAEAARIEEESCGDVRTVVL